ncbi:hypothetical protein SAY86_009041 [Trapa natans]|uniref:Uncharacterized protein n=1 Tax=Trapa natans TaxID=22666 RepID=A0AAN7K7F7_TRANT|nr:hypothetical protein SAY86_009041 [Trapa natans]
MAASNGSEYFEYEIESGAESLAQPSNAGSLADDENELRWAAIERLPSAKRMNMALMRRSASEQAGGKPQDKTIDVRKLDRQQRARGEESSGYYRSGQLQATICDQGAPRSCNGRISSGLFCFQSSQSILTGLKIFRPRRHSNDSE